jgi:cell division protein FtsI (penicillin-binding protein 3)
MKGTASTLVVPGFRCGGKTGTANKYDPALKGYSPDHYLSTFAGLAPIDHPRLAIAVVIDDPSEGDHFGAKVAGPVFARIASEALRYLGVPGEPAICPPPLPGAPASGAVKTCVPAPPSTQARPQPANPTPAAAPSGAAVPAQAPGPKLDAMQGQAHGPRLDAGPAAALASDPPVVSIPEFRGMGMARAIARASEAHVIIEISGTGRVVRQAPAPGPFQQPGAPRVVLQFSDGTPLATRQPGDLP